MYRKKTVLLKGGWNTSTTGHCSSKIIFKGFFWNYSPEKRMELGFAARLSGFERCHRGVQCRLIAATTQEGGLEMTPSLTLAADYMRLPCSVI